MTLWTLIGDEGVGPLTGTMGEVQAAVVRKGTRSVTYRYATLSVL